MSVAIVLEVPLSSGTRSIPVATQQVFVDHWLPVAAKLGLKWLPLFECGVNLELSDLPGVIEELLAAERSFSSSGDLHLQQRAQLALAALKEALSNATPQRIFVG